MRPTPDTVRELIADLEAHYKPRCKDPHETLDDHMMYAGEVRLIADLRRRYEWTQENHKIQDI